jgi:hypothetical protein
LPPAGDAHVLDVFSKAQAFQNHPARHSRHKGDYKINQADLPSQQNPKHRNYYRIQQRRSEDEGHGGAERYSRPKEPDGQGDCRARTERRKRPQRRPEEIAQQAVPGQPSFENIIGYELENKADQGTDS